MEWGGVRLTLRLNWGLRLPQHGGTVICCRTFEWSVRFARMGPGSLGNGRQG